MKRSILAALAALMLCASLLPEPALAADAADPKAKTLDQLLRDVRSARERQRKENQAREAEFRSKKEQQQRLLAEARAKRDAALAESAELEKAFDENEARIPELQETLRNRLGTLGELFGVVRQVAGDTRGFLETSLISAEHPGRAQRLAKLAQSKELPTVEELEELWFVLQEEMTEAGKVTRFSTDVVTLDGDEVEREVIRIGPFSAITDGRYLQYLPETGKLAELARQPGARHLASVREFTAAEEGLAPISIDPSRGTILSLLIRTPNLREQIDQGGLVGYVIIALFIVGLAVSAERLVALGLVGRKMKAQQAGVRASDDNPLGRVLKVYEANPSADVETLELKLDEAILKEVPRLERGSTLIKVLSVVGPLLGLLGTVTGMIKTFQVITLFGTGDPKLMAGGISEALVTTVLGLIMAIPLLLLHSVVSGKSKALVQVLEEQSAGLVASRAERLHAVPGGKGAAAL